MEFKEIGLKIFFGTWNEQGEFKSKLSRAISREIRTGEGCDLDQHASYKNLFQRGLSLKMRTIQFFGIVGESP